MLSRRCMDRNTKLIPKLLSDHHSLLFKELSVVDLSTAENQLLLDRIRSDLKETCWHDCDLEYCEGVGGSSKVRQLIADLANDYFNPYLEIQKDHIVLGAGGCFALDALVEQICDPGDGILIASPYWPGLDLSIGVRQNAIPMPVHVPLESFFDIESISFYETVFESAKIPVKAVLICNPHNPLGKNYPEATLHALLTFCDRYQLHLISDEVYALSQHTSINTPLVGAHFTSVLSLDISKYGKGMVHVLYSLSKDFGCNGIRLGAFISPQNKEVCLSAALSTNCQTSTMANLVSERVILSTKNIEYVTTSGRDLLNRAYQIVENFLESKSVEFVAAECGMYVFARLCHAKSLDEERTFQMILKRHNVIVSAGSDYHFNQPGWFRICYGCQPVKLAEGLDRISKCIEDFNIGRSMS